MEHDEWCPINGCRCGKCGPCIGPPLCKEDLDAEQ